MPPLVALSILAEFAPLSDSAQWALISILTIALILVTIFGILRRQPTLDAVIAKFTIEIKALRLAMDELNASQKLTADHATRINRLETEATGFREVLGKCQYHHRQAQDRVTRELFDRIESWEKTVSLNFQAVERALGNVEGELKAQRPR